MSLQRIVVPLKSSETRVSENVQYHGGIAHHSSGGYIRLIHHGKLQPHKPPLGCLIFGMSGQLSS